MQQGGSQYVVPPTDLRTSQFAPSSAGDGTATRAPMPGISAGADQEQQHAAPPAEAASPISSRPQLPSKTMERAAAPNYEEFDSGGVGGGGFGDDDALAAAGEEADRGGAPGSRWPRQETLTLLKIRSDMDAAFRDATLKGPLWEDVSRKLVELGYNRSAKKCKEKFENVHKYYKRTKEGRAGRQDGKSYRFFIQLEALHGGVTPTPVGMASASPVGQAGPSSRAPPQAATPISAMSPSPLTEAPEVERLPTDRFAGGGISRSTGSVGISLSTSTSSSFSDDSDDETEDAGAGSKGTSRKRKRGDGGSSRRSSSRKMMAFFEGLMKQVMERQEQMQQKFLEIIEKREQDRMIREETWRRQEMARLAREHEIMAQERAVAANRDAAVIIYLQKITGQTIQLPSLPVVTPPPPQPPPPTSKPPSKPPPTHQPAPPPAPKDPPVQQTPPQQRTVAASMPPADLVSLPEPQEMSPASGGYEGVGSSSRWPKSEVHDLIKLRSELEAKYQDAGPKGPLWEEVSAEMQKLGYNRSAKRCKEKWENINKYFKKVKESNKKRPEDAKTCPYFHQLDALYRKKQLIAASAAAVGGTGSSEDHQTTTNLQEESSVVLSQPTMSALPQPNGGGKSGNNEVQTQTSNGGIQPSFYEEGNGSKKPEGIVKELMNKQKRLHQAVVDDHDKLDDADSDNTDQYDDEDDEEEEEDRKMQYTIQFQRQNGGGNTATPSPNPSGKPATTTAGSFFAVVQ